MFFNELIERMGHDEMREIQIKKLRKEAAWAYANVPFYKERFDELGMNPAEIKSLEEWTQFPFTVKTDLRDHYPFGLFAVPKEKLARIHASSGTTGKPTVVGYTKQDLENWAECMARLIVAAGGSSQDIVQISFGYGLFTGAFGLHYGMEKVGAAVVPMSSGNTEKQIMLMKDFGSTILISTPSYALHMAEVMEEMGVTKDEISLRLGMFGAEGSTEEMRRELEERWGILATENYGLSEVMGPGVSGECYCKKGMHINEDHFLVEIVDPATLKPVPDGQWGEVVITTLSKEALPMLRYRTKDISRIITEECECGRRTRRMEKIRGRSDDMLIIRGVNVFPSQIESVLLNINQVSPYYQLIVTRKGYMDLMEVQVELADAAMLDQFQKLQELEAEIRHKLRTILGLDAKVRLVEPKSIERTTGKAKHVIDLRNGGN